MCAFFLFVFKQRTAYESRMSDWSSDVCSSDLLPTITAQAAAQPPVLVANAAQLIVATSESSPVPASAATVRCAFARVRQAKVVGCAASAIDRKRVVWGKSVSVRVVLGGRCIINKKNYKRYETKVYEHRL